MKALKLYWNSLRRKSDRTFILVFYTSSSNPSKDTAFLADLSKFEGAICVVTDQPIDHIELKSFTPSQPIANVVEWIGAISELI